MIKKLILAAFLGSIFMTANTWADKADTAKPAATNDKIEKIKKELKKMFGGEEADKVTESAFPGLYEVTVGTEVVYISEDTQYLFYGNLIDRKNKIDLTRKAKEAAEVAYRKVRKDILDKQDPNKAITFKAKDEKQVLTVFTDIDCPYCSKLHNEVPTLNKNGITVRYLMFPRAGLRSNSYQKAVSVWCADDQQQAMTDAKKRKPVPNKQCDNPVAEQYQLGQEIGVNGTPALVTEDGTLIPGYMPADILIQRLQNAKK